jgi:hypothetical protein
MPLEKAADPDVSRALLDAIAAFPTARDVTHCGTTFQVSPFDIYTTCPACAKRIKVRSFAAVPELEDVFDAVFTWMARPGAAELAQRRQQDLVAEDE